MFTPLFNRLLNPFRNGLRHSNFGADVEVIAVGDDDDLAWANADIEIHLITVTIHDRAIARSVGRVVGAVEGMRRSFDSDKFGARAWLLEEFL